MKPENSPVRAKKLVLAPAVKAALAESRALTNESQIAHSLEALIVVWSEVLEYQSVASLNEFVTSLVGRYTGGSHWCPRDDGIREWADFFSVFADIMEVGDIAGVEWWIRRQSGLESKNFHFDKDEQLFEKEGRFATPVYGSVFYLSEGGGPTLVAAQRIDSVGELSPSVPSELAAVDCGLNRLLKFPGDLNHGVLGCKIDKLRTTLIMNWWGTIPMGVELTPPRINLPKITLASPNCIRPRLFQGSIFLED